MNMKPEQTSKDKIRFITIAECDFGFMDCIENDDCENASSYYESIKHIYKEKLSKLRKQHEAKIKEIREIIEGGFGLNAQQLRKYILEELENKFMNGGGDDD